MTVWILRCSLLLLFTSRPTFAQNKLILGVHESDRALMAEAAGDRLTVAPLPSILDTSIDYDAINQLSQQLQDGNYQAVVGSFEYNIAIPTEKMGIPYLVHSFGSASARKPNTFYLLPGVEDICDCVKDLIQAFHWSRMAIFYEDVVADDSRTIDPLYQSLSDAMMLGKLLQDPTMDLRVWKVPTGATLQELKKPLLEVRGLGINQILVLTPSATVRNLLQEARMLGMAALPYSWLFLNLGSDDFVVEIIEDLSTNVTSINLVKVPDNVLKDKPLQEPSSALSYAVLLDTVTILTTAAEEVQARGEELDGNNFVEAIQKMEISGHTGTIAFDADGTRTNYSLSIYNYHHNRANLMADWNKDRTHNLLLAGEEDQEAEEKITLRGRKVRVVSILESPWLIQKDDNTAIGLKGNARFEGFIPDMMDGLSERLGFTYELFLVPDGNFGSLMESGEWNGMIQQVLNGNASMAASALSINSQRESAIDFTKPFFARFLNALVKTQKQESNFFQFMQPFSKTVWCCILGATGIVCIVLYFLEKYSTSLRSEGDDTPDMSASESYWFTLAAILQQGAESTPATPAGRIVASFWWFFGLIIITSYTANLTAFLTVKNINPPISNVLALASQSKVRYGTVRNSGVENFFKYTTIEPYRTMWEQMQLYSSNVNSTQEGVDLVREGDYAFIWDSSVTSYVAENNCDLTTIGPAFDHKGFGIALPPGTAYRDDMSFAILQLIDEGLMSELQDKWWRGITCPGENSATSETTTALTVEHVAGIFIALIFGLVMAAVACVVDQVVQRCRKSYKKRKNQNRKENGGSDSTQPLNHYASNL